jgi:hypothetical protein
MKLMIRETVFEVFQFLWANRPDLVRMIAAPVLALSILHMALATVFKDYVATTASGITMLQFFALVVAIALPTVFYVMFAVAWHRRCLRPEEQTTILIALKWDHRKTLFLFRFILISVISLVAALPVLVISGIVGMTGAGGLAVSGAGGPTTAVLIVQVIKLLLLFVVMLVQVRLSLLLPATALDQKLTLMEAWVIGRGNSWRLLAVLLLSVAPAMVIVLLVGSAVGAISQATGLGATLTFRFIGQLALDFASYIVVAASVSALSMSYRALRQRPSPGMPYQM